MDNGASSYRRYLDGDEDAFREIVSEYFDNLVFFIDRLVLDTSAAEDIALDAFTQLVVNKRRYDFRASLKTYLFMIGRSRALDYIKHRKKLTMVELSDAEQIPASQPSMEERLLADERRRIIHTALEQLQEPMRSAIYLVYFEELSPEETGKVLKRNRKQIYNLLYRGKQELRAILGKDGELLL